MKRMLYSFVAMLSIPFRYGGLVREMVRREIVVRTNGTWLGGLWILIQPALQVIAFWFLLEIVLKVRSPGTVVFIHYFLVAMIPWIMLSETLGRSASVFSEFSHFYQRTVFPLAVLPWVPLLMAALVYGPIYLVTCLYLLGPESFLKAAGVIILLTLWLVPFCYFFALAGLFFREIRQLVPFLLTLALYVTPILYQPEALPERFREAIRLNPFADLIALIEGLMNGLVMTPDQWMRPLILWLIVCPLVWIAFLKAEPYIRDEL